jgi:hypothetical protein
VVFELVIRPNQVAFFVDDREEAEVVLFKAPLRKIVARQVFKPTSR